MVRCAVGRSKIQDCFWGLLTICPKPTFLGILADFEILLSLFWGFPHYRLQAEKKKLVFSLEFELGTENGVNLEQPRFFF